jgi:nucleotide-binding universal stress UspA family protein
MGEDFPVNSFLKPSWSKPAKILLASDVPADEKTFAFALAQSAEFGAELIIFHAIDTVAVASSDTAAIRDCDCASVARAKKHCLESLGQRARSIGIRFKIVIRHGMAADQILTFLREQRIDRVVMGVHSPGPIGKLLVGSVAEAVIRNANVPVCIVGPDVVASTYRDSENRNILCDVSTEEGRRVVASFGAELAAEQHAILILQEIIRPQEKDNILADRTIGQIEAELPSLVPVELKGNINVRTKVALGDPTEELLYGARAQNASFIVLGAQGASHFAAISRAGIVYKLLAFARCPVITLSPQMLNACETKKERFRSSEVNYIAGVI